jgi:hypothetical protein
MKNYFRAAWLGAALLAASGCSSGTLRIEPSAYGLTPEMIEYVDGIGSTRDTMDVYPIAYVSGGKSTNRFADKVGCFLLYVYLEQLGKLDEGYAYQDVEMLWPVWIGAENYRYDVQGETVGSRKVDGLGLYWPLPLVILGSVFVERNTDHRASKSYSDFGLKLLQLPSVDTCLLKISSAGFDLLFIPLWTKDRSPRKPPAGEGAPPEGDA